MPDPGTCVFTLTPRAGALLPLPFAPRPLMLAADAPPIATSLTAGRDAIALTDPGRPGAVVRGCGERGCDRLGAEPSGLTARLLGFRPPQVL